MKLPHRPPTIDEGLDLLTPEQACEYIKIPMGSLIAKSRAGIIPCGRFGMSYRYLRRRLYEWVERIKR